MKNRRVFAIHTVLPLVLVICSCDGLQGTSSGSYKSFTYDLRGTWASNEPGGLYLGTLKIGSDTITIDGYGEDWLSIVGDDSKRPFKDFPKGVPHKGYSEEGKIFINYGGSAQNGIPYIYTEGDYPNKYKLLEFTFGERKEFLKCTDGP